MTRLRDERSAHPEPGAGARGTVRPAERDIASLCPPDLHVVVDDTVVGPLGPDEAVRLAAGRRLGPETFAWHPALDEWAKIGQLPELHWLLALPEPLDQPAHDPDRSGATLAGFGRRAAAGIADALFCAVLVIVPASVLGFWPVLIGIAPQSPATTTFDWVATVVIALYFIVPMSRLGGGATFGYRLFRLRLIEETTSAPPGLGRTLLWYVATLGLIVGWLTYFIDSKRRMLQNLVSDTIVVVLPRVSAAEARP